MNLKALVVTNDDSILPTVEDILCSLGHEHDHAGNQLDAQRLLRTRDYEYVLMDLRIPARPNRKLADKDFGLNLLADIARLRGPGHVPVIVVCDTLDCFDLTFDLLEHGASDFVAKPFQHAGRTLASVIRRVLKRHRRKVGGEQTVSTPSRLAPAREFAGGEVVLHCTRIEIAGVDIPLSRVEQRILAELRVKRASGKFVAYSGDELAERIGVESGQNGVSGFVRSLRRKISLMLLEEANLECGREDVIQSRGPGYRLNEWITVREANRVTRGTVSLVDDTGDPVNELDAEANDPVNDPDRGSDDPVNRRGDPVNDNTDSPVGDPAGRADDPVNEPDDAGGDTDLNERQRWTLHQLERGLPLRVNLVAGRFRCSPATVKRDFAVLKRAGQIEFVGSPRSGYYRLCRKLQA